MCEFILATGLAIITLKDRYYTGCTKNKQKCNVKLKINEKYIPSFFINNSSPSKPIYYMTIDHIIAEIWSI